MSRRYRAKPARSALSGTVAVVCTGRRSHEPALIDNLQILRGDRAEIVDVAELSTNTARRGLWVVALGAAELSPARPPSAGLPGPVATYQVGDMGSAGRRTFSFRCRDAACRRHEQLQEHKLLQVIEFLAGLPAHLVGGRLQWDVSYDEVSRYCVV